MNAIDAEYLNGVLRPATPLALKPGARVRLVVMSAPDPRRWDLQRLAGSTSEDLELAETGLDEWSDALRREDER